MDLTSRAMLVSVSIGYWRASARDSQVERDVEAENSVEPGVLRVLKKLTSGCTEYQAVTAAGAAARASHLKLTLPWCDTGARILSSAGFNRWADQMSEHRDTFQKASDAFVPAFPGLLRRAESELNGLFKATDYPDADKLPEMFKFRTKVTPVPDAADFRVSLDADVVATIKGQLQAEAQEAFQAATEDARGRLTEVLTSMGKVLATPDKIFRDSLFSNVADMCNILQDLNLMGDVALTDAISSVRKVVLSFSPELCRKDTQSRERLALEVDAIVSRMASYA